jgi:hypothetical protein
MCLAGRIPLDVRPVFYGAALCALTKKGGVIRPIAIGSALRRLVAKAACRTLKDAVVRLSSGLELRMVRKLLYVQLVVFWRTWATWQWESNGKD